MSGDEDAIDPDFHLSAQQPHHGFPITIDPRYAISNAIEADEAVLADFPTFEPEGDEHLLARQRSTGVGHFHSGDPGSIIIRR